MKRFLWALSGIAAAVLISFAGSSSANAASLLDDSSIEISDVELVDLDNSGDISSEEFLLAAYAANYCDGSAVNDSKCLQQIYNAMGTGGGTDSNTIAVGVISALLTSCVQSPNLVGSTSVCGYLGGIFNNLGTITSDLDTVIYRLADLPTIKNTVNSMFNRLDDGMIVKRLTDTFNMLDNNTGVMITHLDTISRRTTTIMNMLDTNLNDLIVSNEAAKNYLASIVDNGIVASVDQSGVINATNQNTQAVNNAANQAHSDAQNALAEQKKANQIAEEQKNFVTDTSTPDASDLATSDSVPGVGLLPEGPIDSILLLPVNILNSIIQSFGGTCKPVIAPLPFVDEEITWPCMTDVFYTGDFEILGTLVGGVSSALLLFYWFKHLYKKVDRATSLETTDEDEWGIL